MNGWPVGWNVLGGFLFYTGALMADVLWKALFHIHLCGG